MTHEHPSSQQPELQLSEHALQDRVLIAHLKTQQEAFNEMKSAHQKGDKETADIKQPLFALASYLVSDRRVLLLETQLEANGDNVLFDKLLIKNDLRAALEADPNNNTVKEAWQQACKDLEDYEIQIGRYSGFTDEA